MFDETGRPLVPDKIVTSPYPPQVNEAVMKILGPAGKRDRIEIIQATS